MLSPSSLHSSRLVSRCLACTCSDCFTVLSAGDVMPYVFPDLVVCITSTALFDCSESHRIWGSGSADELEAYKKHQRERVNEPYAPGVGFTLVQNLLYINTVTPKPLVEVVIVSRNDTESGERVLTSIRHHRLSITRHAFTGGTPVVRYLDNFQCSLFLSTEPDDVRNALATKTATYDGIAAALVTSIVNFDHSTVSRRSSSIVYITAPSSTIPTDSTISSSLSVPYRWPEGQVRIAFDGDGVLFSDEAEQVYQQQGLDAYQRLERVRERIALPAGPMHRFAMKLQSIKTQLPVEHRHLIRTFLVTARNHEATHRAVQTLKEWGLAVDESFFLGGADKTPVLRTINPAIFFDDSKEHIDRAQAYVPTGHVTAGVLNTPTQSPSSEIHPTPPTEERPSVTSVTPTSNGDAVTPGSKRNLFGGEPEAKRMKCVDDDQSSDDTSATH